SRENLSLLLRGNPCYTADGRSHRKSDKGQFQRFWRQFRGRPWEYREYNGSPTVIHSNGYGIGIGWSSRTVHHERAEFRAWYHALGITSGQRGRFTRLRAGALE